MTKKINFDGYTISVNTEKLHFFEASEYGDVYIVRDSTGTMQPIGNVLEKTGFFKRHSIEDMEDFFWSEKGLFIDLSSIADVIEKF